MIAPSRKRRGSLSLEESLRLHLQLARRAELEMRLLHGASGALVGSLIGLLFAGSVAAHALFAVVGFAIGAVLPAPGAVQRAFGSIREQAGLSYETALELRDRAAELPDPFDFRSRVDERARNSVRDVRPRSRPAWWVPLMAVAFGLLLLPAFGPAQGNGQGGGLGAEAFTPGEAAVDATATDAQEAEVEWLEQAAGRVEEPDGLELAGPEDGSGAAAAPGTQTGSSAPLSRFLDTLRERPPDSGGESRGADDGQPDDQVGDQAAGRSGDGQADPQRFEFGDNPPDGASEDGRTAGVGSEDASTGSGEGEDQVLSDDGEGEDAPNAQGAQNPFQQAGGEDFEPAGGDMADDQLPDGGQTGAQSDDPDGDGGADVVAGSESGVLQAAGFADPGSDAQAELLSGVLAQGPESSIGAVLLPGQEDLDLPPGTSFTSYAAAAEEALTEGDLPLEYQDIIRRYFQ